MRGEFIRGDGLVLPNNVTQFGASIILRSFFVSTFGWDPLMILGNGVYTPTMGLADFEEATAGGQHTWKGLQRNEASWPTGGYVNGEPYNESAAIIFDQLQYDRSATRIALVDGGREQVVALSSPLPEPLLITPTTPEIQRTFRYRMYLR